MFTGKRFVVWADGPVGRATWVCLSHLLGQHRVDLATSEADAKELLWTAGDSELLCDSTHLICVGSAELLPSKLFNIHCRFRPNLRQTATLHQIGPGWSGGILFVGRISGASHHLESIPPFNRIAGGHQILAFPYSLPQLLHSLGRLEPVFPEAWKLAMESLHELTHVRHAIDTYDGTLEAASRLLTASQNLLNHRVLDKLLAHRTVIGELRQIIKERGQASGESPSTDLGSFASQVSNVLADYL